MKIIDKYIGGGFLKTFFFIITLLLLISIVIDLTENLDNMLEHSTPAIPIINYYLDFSPWILSLLAPLFVFISVIFFTSRLTNNSEIIATISGGVSFYRLLVPYLVSASIIALLFFYTNHYVLPKANGDIIDFKQEYLGKNERLNESTNIHIQIDSNKILYLKNFNVDTKRGYNLQIETFKGNNVVYKIKARTMVWLDSTKVWSLSNVTERRIWENGEELTTSRNKKIELPVVPQDFVVIKRQWTTLKTPQLNKEIKRERKRGSQYAKYYVVEKHKRTATPVAIIIFTVMGVAIASRKVRGGTGLHLSIGFLLSALFILLLNFSETFAQNTAISPLVSVWIPNIFFGIITGILLWKAQK